MSMTFTLSSSAPADIAADLLAIPVFQEKISDSSTLSPLNQRLDGLLGKLAEEERFEGKAGQTLSFHTHGRIGAQRLMIFGVGPAADFQASELRHLAAKAARSARNISAKTIAVLLPAGHTDERALQFTAEGVTLGRYRFDRYLSSEDKRRPDQLQSTTLVANGATADTLKRAVTRAEAVAAAIMRTRDLVNEPASEATPRRLAAEAEKLAQAHGLEVKVLGPKECRELGMGMFLAVAQGSDEEPRFIHLAYKPKNAGKKVVLIGKGVTFDSGGLSLKPNDGMLDMKTDMAGAATVISTIGAIAQLGLPVEVHALAACTENMPSGKSYKLGDVLRSMAGKTVEINNTDAEGRLTLGDAISYAQKLSPDEIFDFATLTGACMVALGPHIAGVMTNNAGLSERWLAAAKSAGEDMWPLPLPPRLMDMLKSEVADMKNTGERWGGALTAGLFLKEFAENTPWVHVDIAGPSNASKEYGAIAPGGTGFAVATIVEYLGH